MWIPQAKSKRFTLYHLDENETYIKDFAGTCTYTDPLKHEEHVKEKGKFYICSKSIVFEADQQNVPLYKFKYESMKTEPRICTFGVTQTTKTRKISPKSPWNSSAS